jgi:hypothetical protein
MFVGPGKFSNYLRNQMFFMSLLLCLHLSTKVICQSLILESNTTFFVYKLEFVLPKNARAFRKGETLEHRHRRIKRINVFSWSKWKEERTTTS